MPHSQRLGRREEAKKALATGTGRVSTRPGWAGEKERAVEWKPSHRSQREEGWEKPCRSPEERTLSSPVRLFSDPVEFGITSLLSK